MTHKSEQMLMAIYENIVSIGTRKENILINKILKCSFRFYNQTYI